MERSGTVPFFGQNANHGRTGLTENTGLSPCAVQRVRRPRGTVPGVDLRRHQHLPGELLIIPTRIGMGTMRTSCRFAPYFAFIDVHFLISYGPNFPDHRKKWPGCVCAKTATALFAHTHPLN